MKTRSKPNFSWLPSLSLVFILSACTPKSSFETSRWNGQGDRPPVPVKESDLRAEPQWASLNEQVQTSQQTIAGFPVEGTFVKTINQNNQIVFQSYALAESIPQKMVNRAIKLNGKKNDIWKMFLQKNAGYRSWHVESGPEVVFSRYHGLKPVVRTLLSSPHGRFVSVSFSDKGYLISADPVGSRLTDSDKPAEVPALAFPMGPKKSELSRVLLSRMAVATGLTNSKVEVRSQSPSKITVDQNLELPPSDERFDQVQAFYFANEILGWFDKKLSLQSPLKLVVVTDVGYPEKTNTAFYFQNQIRLGSGDNVTFTKIPWDPSIVMHETAHAVIDGLARLPFQGEGGSLNEGFADVFATFYLKSPYLGDSSYRKADYKRSVEQTLKLSDRNGGLYHDSAIVSGFFWSLRSSLGEDKALNLAVHVLHRLAPNSNFEDFALALREQTNDLFKAEDLKKVNELMHERGLQ